MANADITVPLADLDEWLTIPRTVHLLNCPPHPIRELIRQEKLMARRVTLTLVYRPSATTYVTKEEDTDERL